jgi:hypothetical protein
MDKTIRRVTYFEEQEAEAYRYWQRQPVGDLSSPGAVRSPHGGNAGFYRWNDLPDW